MNFCNLLLILIFLNLTLCCHEWFRIKQKSRQLHGLKTNKVAKKHLNHPKMHHAKKPKWKETKRKEKKKVYKITKNKPINSFQIWNNKMNKALKIGTSSFVKNIVHLPKLMNKAAKNKTWNIKTNKKINDNFAKLNKGAEVWPEVITDLSNYIDESLKPKPFNPNCIHNAACKKNNDCGNIGVCYSGKCRCSCKEFSSCFSHNDCPGKIGKCFSKCIGKNGTSVNCGLSSLTSLHTEDQLTKCARGSQCLSGICVGGGRERNFKGIKFFEAVSCSGDSEDISCNNIGIEQCSTELGLVFRHTNSKLIGTKSSIYEIDRYHITLNINFPACYNGKMDFVPCGEKIENSCMEGSYCGHCQC